MKTKGEGYLEETSRPVNERTDGSHSSADSAARKRRDLRFLMRRVPFSPFRMSWRQRKIEANYWHPALVVLFAFLVVIALVFSLSLSLPPLLARASLRLASFLLSALYFY